MASDDQQPSTSASSALEQALLQRSRRSSELLQNASGSNISMASRTLPHSMSMSNGYGQNSSFGGGSDGGGKMKRSSLHAHRSSLYARPTCLSAANGSYISNRYFSSNASENAGSGRSVILAAKKVSENSSVEPEFTPEAQKIVRFLQKYSAPVVNKEKVAMEAIKLRPELPSMKRKEPSSGPPILRSPYDLSPQSMPPIKAPRMNWEANGYPKFSPGSEKSDETEEFEFPEAWSFEDICNGVRHTENKRIEVDNLLKLFKHKEDPGLINAVPAISEAVTSSGSSSAAPSKTISPATTEEIKTTQPAPDAKWECPSCMVFNLMSADACVCCCESNPNKPAKSEPAAAHEGAPSNWAKKPTSQLDFAFGFGPGQDISKLTKSKPSEFQFGGKVDDKAPPKTEFKFGFGASPAAPNTTPASEAKDQSKGASTPPKTTQETGAQTKGITLGVGDGDEEKAIETVKFQPLSGFRFGCYPAKPSITISKPEAPKPPEPTWRCNKCSDESNAMSQLNCRGCQAPRLIPQDPMKPVSGIDAKKDFSFKPFSGLKDETTTSTPTSPPFVSSFTTPFSSAVNSQTPAPSFSFTQPQATAPPESASTPRFTSPTPVSVSGTPLFTSAGNAPQSTLVLTPATVAATASPSSSASPGDKRKAEPETFMFNASEPKLKMRAPAEPTGATQPTAPFPKSTTASAPSIVPTTSATTAFAPPASTIAFQFNPPTTQAQTTAPSSIFGSSAPTTAVPSSGFNFAAVATSPLSPLQSNTPAPGLFQFGQVNAPTNATTGASPFAFGQNPGAPGGFKPTFAQTSLPASNMFSQPSATPTPAFGSTATPVPPMFNTTPNTNFGAAVPPAFGMGMGMPQQQPGAPALFNLGSGAQGERKIRKAVRRFK